MVSFPFDRESKDGMTEADGQSDQLQSVGQEATMAPDQHATAPPPSFVTVGQTVIDPNKLEQTIAMMHRHAQVVTLPACLCVLQCLTSYPPGKGISAALTLRRSLSPCLSL